MFSISRSLFCFLAVASLCAKPNDSGSKASHSPALRDFQTARWVGPSPKIDGKLDEVGWQAGLWAGDFTQREPIQGGKPSYETRIKAFYDDHHLYIAFRCYDPKVTTRPRVLASPDEFAGDMVGVSIDSYLNRKTAYEFNVTSGGSKIDALLPNFGWSDASWRAVWDVKVAYESDAWTAEFSIPLSQLRYAPAERQTWGIHFWRWIDEFQEEDQYSFIPIDHSGYVRSFGTLKGIERLPRSRRLEAAPYTVISYETHAPETGNPIAVRRKTKWNAGMDAKYGLDSGLTLDATVNPDFGQVEADPSEINLSTVETFLKEQRPFFLEGKTVFDFKIEEDSAFYSRRIGAAPPLDTSDSAYAVRPAASRVLGSAKLTGRTEQGLAVGALWATTDRTYADVSDGTTSGRTLINPLTHYFALRAQQDMQDGDLVVGGLATGAVRAGTDDELRELTRQALVFGVDGTRYWNGHSYFVDGRLLFSHLQGSRESITEKTQEWVHNYQRVDADTLDVPLEATNLDGHAGSLRFGKDNSGAWRYQAGVVWRSPGFDMNDVGYLGQADTFSPTARLEYFSSSDTGRLRRQLHSLRFRESRDFSGLLTGRSLFLVEELNTAGNHGIWAQAGARMNRLDTRILRGGPALRLPENATLSMDYSMSGNRRFSPGFWFDWTRAFAVQSSYLQVAPSLTYRPSSRTTLKLVLEGTFNRQKYQYAATGDFGGADGWVMSRFRQNTLATTLRLSHNFSPALSLSYYAGPYISSGKYSQFKRVISPRAAHVGGRYRLLDPVLTDGTYRGNDQGVPYSFDNPDFSWRELKSNMVLRWEYRPGSFLYCVWSQQRSDGTDDLEFKPVDEHRKLFSARPENVLMVKASYWFSL